MSYQCLQCEQYKKENEEKDKQITILQSNLLTLKGNLIESSNLISAYVQIQNENEVLKKENEVLRLQKETNMDQNQLEILKQKILNLQQTNSNLKLAYNQTTELLNQYQSAKDPNNSKENKLKRELSEKDKQINSQNLIINRLRNDKKSDEGAGALEANENNNNDELVLEKQSSSLGLQLKQLVEENEHLAKKYKKYNHKYVKYYHKYNEYKKCSKMFMMNRNYYEGDTGCFNNEKIMEMMTMMMLNRKRGRRSSDDCDKDADDILGEENKEKKEKVLKEIYKKDQSKPRVSFDYDNCKIEDIFEKNHEDVNDYNDNPNDDKSINSNGHDIVIDENKEEYNKGNKKTLTTTLLIKEKEKVKTTNRTIKKTKGKKNEEQDALLNHSISDKEEDNHVHTRNSATKKTILKEVDIKKPKESKPKIKKEPKKKEITIEVQEPKPEVNQSPQKEQVTKVVQPVPHINPIKSSKKDPQSNTNNIIEEFSIKLFKYINDKTTQATKETIILLFNNIPTISEKVTSLLEVIISNIPKLNIAKTLYTIDIFTSSYDSNIVIANFLEFINTHLNSLTVDNKFQYTNTSISKYPSKTLSTHHSSTHFISYLLAIFYQYPTVSEIAQFIFNLLDGKNSKRFEIISFFNELLKDLPNQSPPINHIFINPTDLSHYHNSNKNSFYFFNSVKSKLISQDIFNYLLNTVTPTHSQKETIDTYIISAIKKKFDTIDNDTLINPTEKIDLCSQLAYIELYQMVYIAFNLRDVNWVLDAIFTMIICEEFSKTKDKSLKRALLIYYSSFICYLCLGKENYETNEKLVRLVIWLFSIYTKKFEAEKVTVYDQLCALSWVVDSNGIIIAENLVSSIKEVIQELIKGYTVAYFPKDFVMILKKNKLYDIE